MSELEASFKIIGTGNEGLVSVSVFGEHSQLYYAHLNKYEKMKIQDKVMDCFELKVAGREVWDAFVKAVNAADKDLKNASKD